MIGRYVVKCQHRYASKPTEVVVRIDHFWSRPDTTHTGYALSGPGERRSLTCWHGTPERMIELYLNEISFYTILSIEFKG